MSKSNFLSSVNDDIETKNASSIGRPKGSYTTPRPKCFANIPFTEEEDKAIEMLAKEQGCAKRQLIKRFIAEGLERSLQK